MPFPLPGETQSDLDTFYYKIGTVPVVVASIGLIVAAFVLFGLLCGCCCKPRGSPTKPSSMPVCFLAIFVIAALVICTLVCWKSGGDSYRVAKQQLDRAVTDLSQASSDGSMLNATGLDALHHLDLLYKMCPPPTVGILKTQIGPIEQQIQEYVDTIAVYTKSIQPVADQLSNVQSNSAGYGVLIAATFTLPIALVSCACLIIIFGVLTTRGCGGPKMARCNDCCILRLGSVFIALAVLLAAWAAAGELGAGILSSSFCAKADSNVMLYAQSALGSNTEGYKVAEYYIVGAGANPLNQSLDDASKYVSQANATLSSLTRTYGNIIHDSCKGWTADDINTDISKINAGIQAAKSLVSKDNIYPYYDKIVHDDLCGTVIASFGWLATFQLLIGLLCLPVLAFASGRFFKKWAAWNDARRTLAEREVFIVQSNAGGNQMGVYPHA